MLSFEPRSATRRTRTQRARCSLAALAILATSAAVGACSQKAAPTAPTESIDRAGIRIEYPQPQHLTFARGAEFEIKSVLNVPGPIEYGDYVWDTDAVPAGAIRVLVDLKSQTMSVFRGPHEIGATVLLFGMKDKPTPVGRFTVLSKDKDHWSNTYDAPMPYALMLTGDGVAIHGSDVRFDSATHGCLGVPLDFASKLFAVAKVGDQVIVTRDAQAS